MHWKQIDQIAEATGKSRKAIRQSFGRLGAPDTTVAEYLEWLATHKAEQARRRKERAKKWAKGETRAEYRKKYRESGRDAERQRKYYAANPERFGRGSRMHETRTARERRAEWKARANERERERRKLKPQQVRAEERIQYQRKRQKPEVVIRTRLRNRLVYALRQSGRKAPKYASALSLAGCSIEELMRHIESLFKPGMAWNNRHLWHIDHIRPVSSFDMMDLEEQKKCFHFTNLQPLWRAENLAKGAKVIELAAA